MPPEPGRRRVILHFGPPKTGTSALQAWCAAQSSDLARHGVHYASADRADDPKHQWLLKEMQTGRFDRLREEVGRLTSGTLILSCEGIMVHRGKIGPAGWERFRAELEGTERCLFLVQRQTEDWVRLLWRQGVLNPVGQARLSMPSLAAFAASPWLREMIALPDLARRMAQDAGAESVTIARYESDWLASFRDLARLPIGALPEPLPRVHDSPPEGFLRLYLALASEREDVSQLRQTLFAVYCRANATTNLTLQATARAFGRLDRVVQAGQLAALVEALASKPQALVDEAGLAAELASVATDWQARL